MSREARRVLNAAALSTVLVVALVLLGMYVPAVLGPEPQIGPRSTPTTYGPPPR